MNQIRLPALFLSLVLQLAPLMRIAVAESVVVGSPLVTILRWIAGTAAVAGAFHGVSGASGMTVQQGGASVTQARGTNGVVLAGVRVQMFSAFGAPRAFTFNQMPPGLSGSAQGVITGIPTKPGTYNVLVIGWEFAGAFGNSFVAVLPFTVVAAVTLDPPTISSPPQSQSIVVGQPVTFSATVVGSSLSYQWKKDGNPIPAPAGTGATLTLSAVQPADAGNYTVLVSNTSGSAESDPATLSVITAPVIVAPPVSQSVASGSPLTLTVQATGTGLSYQWFKEDTALQGASAVSPTYFVPAAFLVDAGNYTVRVSNAAGVAVGGPVSVSVISPPIVSTPPQSQTLAEGAPLTLNVSAVGVGLSYQWFFNEKAIPGPVGTASSLVIGAVKPSDAGVYSVVVSNSAGTASSGGATVVVVSAPVLVSGPKSQTLGAGSPLVLSAEATGTGLSFQWRKDTVAIPAPAGTASTLSISSATPADSGVYTVSISNLAGSVTSEGATVTVLSIPSIVTGPQGRTVAEGTALSLTASVSGSGLSYQWIKDGTPLPAPLGTSVALEFAAVKASDAGVYSLRVSNLAGTATSEGAAVTVVSLPVIASEPKGVSVTLGSSFTLEALVTGTGLAFQWLKDNVALPAPLGTGSTLTIASAQSSDAGLYVLRVTNLAGTVSTTPVNVAVVTPTIDASLTVFPLGGTAYEGETVNLRAVVSTTLPATFKWTKDGAPIPEATSGVLTLASLKASDAGRYRVEVTAGAATALTQEIKVTLAPLPVLTLLSVGSDTSAELTVSTIPGRSYAIEERKDLGSVDWTGVATVTADAASPSRVTIPAAAGPSPSAVGLRFWRARVLPLVP